MLKKQTILPQCGRSEQITVPVLSHTCTLFSIFDPPYQIVSNHSRRATVSD